MGKESGARGDAEQDKSGGRPRRAGEDRRVESLFAGRAGDRAERLELDHCRGQNTLGLTESNQQDL